MRWVAGSIKLLEHVGCLANNGPVVLHTKVERGSYLAIYFTHLESALAIIRSYQHICDVELLHQLSFLLFQGETPKDLAVQFQKQDCVDFLTSAEVEADIFEYAEGIIIIESDRMYVKFFDTYYARWRIPRPCSCSRRERGVTGHAHSRGPLWSE